MILLMMIICVKDGGWKDRAGQLSNCAWPRCDGNTTSGSRAPLGAGSSMPAGADTDAVPAAAFHRICCLLVLLSSSLKVCGACS